MSLISIVKSALDEIVRVGEYAEGVYVTTPCMYPGNSFVQVIVYGAQNTFSVSDNGGAIRELEGTGASVLKTDKILRAFVKDAGLNYKDGSIFAPICSLEELPIAISMVANASKEMADWLFQTTKVKRTRDFKAIVRAFLKSNFENKLLNNGVIVGASNKPHAFENVLVLSASKKLIIDPVILDPSSINARVVANMDVRLAGIEGLEQRIIYDDEDDWHAEDLNLLQVGASVIPFSKSGDVIRRIAGVH